MCAHASRKVHPRESLASARDRKGSRIRRGKMYLLCDDVECADKAKVNALPYADRGILILVTHTYRRDIPCGGCPV